MYIETDHGCVFMLYIMDNVAVKLMEIRQGRIGKADDNHGSCTRIPNDV